MHFSLGDTAARLELTVQLDFLGLARMEPEQSAAILNGIAAIIAAGREAGITLVNNENALNEPNDSTTSAIR